ncbi:hypothetical protein ALNOE001_03920 [Candidatus Methanobinarius endosymbioticus]|uniref:Uncharacterized protein n=1 Tax=Candidatus Methanobinarius endosymbioticus TaxID=2006182 RepID=A0A366MD43_9EURY|nr:hypothetical protein ALNOE001_03920 [Candidatus Methanobinarius endosymbioticus]
MSLFREIGKISKNTTTDTPTSLELFNISKINEDLTYNVSKNHDGEDFVYEEIKNIILYDIKNDEVIVAYLENDLLKPS